MSEIILPVFEGCINRRIGQVVRPPTNIHKQVHGVAFNPLPSSKCSRVQTPALRATTHQAIVPNCGTVPVRIVKTRNADTTEEI